MRRDHRLLGLKHVAEREREGVGAGEKKDFVPLPRLRPEILSLMIGIVFPLMRDVSAGNLVPDDRDRIPSYEGYDR